MSIEQILEGLNEGQREAVLCSNPKILCLAGAGTGKTHTMLSRIIKLIEIDKVAPSHILALTFTNAAAFEMKRRYQERCITKDQPEFRTFHAFCYSLLSSDPDIRKALGYTQVPEIIDEEAFKRIEELTKQLTGIKLSKSKLADVNLCSPKEALDHAAYHKMLKFQLQQQNAITFDILAKSVSDLFIQYEQIAPTLYTPNALTYKYREKYEYIFVDEFQDTDPLQYKFVMSFENSNKFVVGDAQQALYGFRGADSSLIKRLAGDPTWRKVRLNLNYRSTPRICTYANAIAESYADEKYYVPLVANNDAEDGQQVIRYSLPWDSFGASNEPIEWLVEHLDEFDGTSAVLFRTNAEVQNCVERLTAANISVTTKNSKIDTARILLKCAVDGQYLIDWLSTFLNARDYGLYIREFYMQEMNSADNFDKVQKFVDRFSTNTIIQQYATTVMNLRKVLLSDKNPADRLSEALELLNCDGLHAEPSGDLPQVLWLDLKDTLDAVVEEGIYVGTIHSVKGLEYDNVFLLGVGGRSFKLKSEEDYNIYYVGVTRAKKQLHIWSAESKMYGGAING